MSMMRGSRSLPLSIVLACYLFLSATTEVFQVAFTREVRVVQRPVYSKEIPSLGRTLLQSLPDYGGGDTDDGDTPRRCSKEDISIFQGPTSSFPTGIPEFSVQIMNTCVSSVTGCDPIADVHVKCGWFSSVQMINPAVFRRVNYDDCLVNDGQPLPPGSILSFKYSNSFSYPLSISSISC